MHYRPYRIAPENSDCRNMCPLQAAALSQQQETTARAVVKTPDQGFLCSRSEKLLHVQ